MKLTKKIESEILKVYHTYWDSSLKGDITTKAACIDDDFQLIGSSEGEIFLNKKDAMQFYNATDDQITGKVELRNRNIKTKPFDELILISEISDIYVLIEDEWVFYSKLRVTSFLKETKNGWKFVQIHASVPDLKTKEGEQLAIEKIKKENLELRDAVKRRTVELEQKNRELEIEAALESVRSLALGMRKSEEVGNVTDRLFEELNKLTLKVIGCTVVVIDEKRDSWETWRARTKAIVKPFEVASFKKSMQLFKKNMPKWFSVFNEALSAREKFLIEEMSKKKRTQLLNSIAEQYNYTEKEKSKLLRIIPDEITAHFLFFKLGYLAIITEKKLPKENLVVARRFAEVFGFAYTRFLDIKKAEEQTREAQIEAALERIRSRALGMHHSSEVGEVSNLLYSEFEKMDITMLGFNIIVLDKGKDRCEMWRAKQVAIPNEFESFSIETMYNKLDHYIPGFTNEFESAWQNRKPYYIGEFKGQRRISFLKANREMYNYSDEQFQKLNDFYPDPILFHMIFFKQGWLGIFRNEFLSENDLVVSHRFAEVFEFAYTRFLDLQKAEARAREAQIEAALERVRARTMAMHKSEELSEVAALVFEQLTDLGIQHFASGFSIFDKNNQSAQMWWNISPKPFPVDFNASPVLKRVYDSWEKGEPFYINQTSGEEFIRHVEFLRKVFGKRVDKFMASTQKKFTDAGKEMPNHMVMHHTFFAYGSLLLNNITPIKEQEILNRFAKVFEQTYTRFLDLQKAEAQAREAEIQLALERVRARTMAMHKSEELSETVAVLFQQFNELGSAPERINICLMKEEVGMMEVWSTEQGGKQIDHSFNGSIYEPTTVAKVYKGWKEGKKSMIIDLTGKELDDWIRYLKEEIKMPFKDELRHERRVHTTAFFSSGALLISTPEPVSQEMINLLEKFADVFNLTYRRFLDLKKAEEQAREALIEAALERVRAKAMAMHSSNDISDTMGIVFTELPKLGISSLRCGVVLLSKDSYKGVFYAAATTDESDSQTVIGEGDMSVHPIFMKQREHWARNENYFITLSGEELKSYYKEIFRRSSTPYNPKEHEIQTEHGYYFSFSEGMFYAWTEEPYSESDIKILERFKSIIDLTFRRYFDLKKAEAQAMEAIKQASLDRVRGEIASMRTAEDLNRITPIIWRELKTFEVPFIRCGVFIVNEQEEQTHVYLSTPDGKSLGVLNLSFDANELTANIVEHWKKKQVYKEHWSKEEFIAWTKSMMELGQVQSAETYQGSSTPPESLNLHFVPFTQGMLYVGDVNPLTDEKLDLVETLAEAFSIAYARYEDFKNIEEAKNKIELTLTELKSAQAQLVHSEKMASLGELTAGIAHEIKNPLNFVNNFSEISAELINEVKVELEKNDKEEVLEILEDLKGNLEKINQHGKRADSIVKGMLLHSRGTSGEKALTDINDLLEQYVNLAYHGMRATNKEFNITIEKDYDETLEKINVVPQDISRVFLNIINNACYAAYDKKKKDGDSFNPVLKVSTKNLDGKVEIRIADNGNGIPKDILDKIFQPFFTTKPTGEGTGLGLSLSYDIVTKVHNGELKVETKEGAGTNFKILLPK